MEKLRKSNEKIEEEIRRLKEEERRKTAEKEAGMGALSAQKTYMEDRIKVIQIHFLGDAHNNYLNLFNHLQHLEL